MRKTITTVAVLLLVMAAKGGPKMPMLKWAGKDKVVNHHNDVPFRVLERKWGIGDCSQTTNTNSVGSCVLRDRAENMIIHGDNLAALKALLPQYEGRVKCIYIDPPYNTGNEEWVYNDNVNDPQIKKWLGEVVGKEGEDFSRHDKWLCMIYPRLRLLQKLLSEDGVLWVSIGDDELANLMLAMREIMGEPGGIFVWKSRSKPTNAGNARYRPQKVTEYVLMYTKDKNKLFNIGSKNSEYSYPNQDEHGNFRTTTILTSNLGSYKRETMRFSIGGYTPPPEKRWNAGKDKMEELFSTNRLLMHPDGDPMEKVYDYDDDTMLTPMYTLIDPKVSGTAESGKTLLNQVIGKGHGFDTVKPVELLEYLIGLSTDKDSVVLDSFAGSGTTAHAVLKMNKEDGGNRKFILVELMDYAETVTAERVKRVISGYGEGEKAVEGTGGGFGYYELGEPLMIGENLNEDLPVEKIREYVWYMETRGAGNVANVEMLPMANANSQLGNGNIGIGNTGNIGNIKNDPYLLGIADGTAYYFCYEKGKAVKLNRALLRKLKTKAERYVIYADICLLDDSELAKYNITFKKIPRDVARL